MAAKSEGPSEPSKSPDSLVSPPIIDRFGKSLANESDRGCALVAAARLDRDLGELLRAALPDASQASKKDLDYLLNGPLAPLRSFGVRTRMAHALGLIASEVRKTLDAIREIRNEFAHQEDATGFPAELVKRAMEHPLKGYINSKGQVAWGEESKQSYDAFCSQMRKRRQKFSETRIQFLFAVYWVRTHLVIWHPEVFPEEQN